jgi:cbb3-type cytochrome oxidase subunit 3
MALGIAALALVLLAVVAYGYRSIDRDERDE